MKNIPRLLVLFAVLAFCLTTNVTAFAQTPTQEPGTDYLGDKVVIGDTFRLEDGDTLTGDLVIVGGTAIIENGSRVDGDIVLTGGTITINGTVDGDAVFISGVANLGDTAVINGNLVTVGTSLSRSPMAQISGDVTVKTPSANEPNNTKIVPSVFSLTDNPLAKILEVTFISLTLATFAAIIGLLLPKPIQRVANTLEKEAGASIGIGLISIICATIAFLIMCVTIILIPIAVLALLLVMLAYIYGWFIVGYEIGVRISKLFHSSWSIPIASGVGVFLLSLVAGIAGLIPCLGAFICFIIASFGLGAVVISRFGSEKYAQEQNRIFAATPPPAPPAPPAQGI